MRAIQIQEFGGPEKMELVELPDPEPGEGEVLVEVARCGINFADTHQRENDYLAPAELPLVPGAEISGTTADGRRVAALLANGGYAEKVAVPENVLVPLPDEVSDEQGAAILLQGLTAWALLEVSAKVQEGETVVIEAAAGGTGSLATQLAKARGAKVIGLASSAEKREHVERLGADATVDSTGEQLGEAILEANGGNKVEAILHMTGGEAFRQELGVLAPYGRMVVFGMASREPNEVPTGHLMQTSRTVAGFWLVHLFRRPELMMRGIGELLGSVASGALEVVIGGTYPLADASDAHVELQERRTHGKLLLDPTA